MPSTTPDIGTGMTFTLPGTPTMEVRDLDGTFEHEAYEYTHFASPVPSATEIGGRQFVAADLGRVEMDITVLFNPDEIDTLIGTEGTGTVAWPTASASMSGTCIVTSCNPSFEANGLMEATISLIWSGVVTIVSGA